MQCPGCIAVIDHGTRIEVVMMLYSSLVDRRIEDEEG